MAITSYTTLAPHEGELKWMLADLAATAEDGVSQADLTSAETWAFDRVNAWILKVAGGKKGGEIIAEFAAASSQTEVDPAIRQLAHYLAAARVLRLYEQRNEMHAGVNDPSLRRKDWREVHEEAMRLAKDIETTKRTVKADGTIRTWGMGRLAQGPVVGGPMSGGSLFADDGVYHDLNGVGWRTPHRHPLAEGSW